MPALRSAAVSNLWTTARSAARSTASCRSACSSMSACPIIGPSSISCAQLLADDGVALLHTIGRTDGPGVTSPWTAKYIFPGGYAPAFERGAAAIERAGLIVTDIEVLRLHYAETLKEWRGGSKRIGPLWLNFTTSASAACGSFILRALKWHSAMMGRSCTRFKLTKCIGTLPLTRDYMFESERTMRFAGTESDAAPGRARSGHTGNLSCGAMMRAALRRPPLSRLIRLPSTCAIGHPRNGTRGLSPRPL